MNYNRRPQRTIKDVPISLVYESLLEELTSDNKTFELLDAGPGQATESVLDLPVYQNHRGVIQARRNKERLPVPLGFYLDGVNYRAQAACKMCEVHVRLTSLSSRKALVRALKWRKGGVGVGGRVVDYDLEVAGVHLQAGDRLEPSKEVLDVAALERLPLPRNVVFWRARRDHKQRLLDSVTHRCVLFDDGLDTSPHKSLAVDALHCLYFGPVMRFVSSSLWRLILKNVWRFTGTLEQVIELGSRQLGAELQQWQEAQNIPHSARLATLSAKMLG
ncbi:unnamed protein product, partial [Prorocentrum cordatum]